MKSSEINFIKNLIKKNQIKNDITRSYPLAGDSFETDDLMSGLKVLLSQFFYYQKNFVNLINLLLRYFSY